MASLLVDSLQFHFDPSHAAAKYDAWSYYREVLQGRELKSVDIVAMRRQQQPATVWLIEVKDFRVIGGEPKESNIAGMAGEVSRKARDTVSVLEEIAIQRGGEEQSHAIRAVASEFTRVVLHLEPHSGPHSALFPANSPAGVLQKLKQLVRDIDRKPLVLCIANTGQAEVPWSVS